MPDLEIIRSQFPALASGFAYLENAGGSQVPSVVADAIRDYMLTNYVQLGAGYSQSEAATKTVDEAHGFMREFVNAPESGRIVLGPSTTALIQLVANACSQVWKEGDEVVIATSNHEANIGGWQRLERVGVRVKWWPVNRDSFRCEPADLERLLTNRTQMVTLPHTSNLVGQIEDLAAICRMAHEVGAKVFADGVAFAPHRAVDVQALGVDWYAFSAYKVYGPHMAVLFGREEAFAELTGPNHWFVPNQDPYKWELGGVSHEACAGLLALRSYLGFLAEESYDGRQTVERAFETIKGLEAAPEARLRDWVRSRPSYNIVGPDRAREDSVPTVSFVHDRLPSDEIARRINAEGIGIRNGHMYAVRLLEGLGIPPDPGVVRISLVHYNSADEVERAVAAIDA